MPNVRNEKRCIAYERYRTVRYPSLRACKEEYGIYLTNQLIDLIEKGGVGPDGYTTFDYLPDDEDIKEFVSTTHDIKRSIHDNGK